MGLLSAAEEAGPKAGLPPDAAESGSRCQTKPTRTQADGTRVGFREAVEKSAERSVSLLQIGRHGEEQGSTTGVELKQA
jgi:hypothetical protein